MYFLRQQHIQKTCAAFLLTLIFFIQVVKTFHTHPAFLQQADYHSKNIPVVHENFTCPICDFQIAKDCDAFVASVEISSPFHFISISFNYTFPNLQVVSTEFIARGPPALC